MNFLNSKTMKTMKTMKFFAAAALAVSMLASCDNNDEVEDLKPVEEEEAITQLVVTYTNAADASDTVVLTWNDENEDEEITENEKSVVGTFKAESTYNAEIALFNKEEDFLDEDILADQASIDAHFFVYSQTGLNFRMIRSSEDNTRSDENKLGVKTIWTAGANAEKGSIKINLYHESPKVSDEGGFGSAEGTDTDIDISFDVEVEEASKSTLTAI